MVQFAKKCVLLAGPRTIFLNLPTKNIASSWYVCAQYIYANAQPLKAVCLHIRAQLRGNTAPNPPGSTPGHKPQKPYISYWKCLFHRKFRLPKFENRSCVTVLRFLQCDSHSRGTVRGCFRFRIHNFRTLIIRISSEIKASQVISVTRDH